MVFAVPNKKVRNYSAVVLIQGAGLFYAVTYGIAHFFVSRFADIDFGIDIAARIVGDYKIKSSRAFGGKLTKSIQTYNDSFELPFDAGESVNYIKGVPFEKEKWGKTISCGQSVQLRKRDFSPSCAHILASRLENTLNDKILKQIPRSAKIVDKAKIDELMNSLIRDMQQGNYMVSVSPQQLSGVEFVFSDIYTYYLQHDSGALELEENLSIETVQTIVKKHFKSDYVKFLNSVVEARKDEEYSFEKKMLCFIDYVDSDHNYYIDDGKWYQFDSNYLNNLKNAVKLIAVNSNPEIRIFNEEQYQKWLRRNQKTEKEYYRERYLNEMLAREYGYENYDRGPFRYENVSVEMADLVKNDEIVFVKIGKPQKLNYVIDQSLNALAVLQRSGLYLTAGTSHRKVNTMILWMFLERDHDISNITDVQSLIFLMKLANWRKEVLMAGLTPVIKVSYRRASGAASIQNRSNRLLVSTGRHRPSRKSQLIDY